MYVDGVGEFFDRNGPDISPNAERDFQMAPLFYLIYRARPSHAGSPVNNRTFDMWEVDR